jgi:hypothetical protein
LFRNDDQYLLAVCRLSRRMLSFTDRVGCCGRENSSGIIVLTSPNNPFDIVGTGRSGPYPPIIPTTIIPPFTKHTKPP